MSGAEEKPWSTWLAKYAVDYAAENAMLVKSKDHKHWDTVGFTLLPRKVGEWTWYVNVELDPGVRIRAGIQEMLQPNGWFGRTFQHTCRSSEPEPWVAVPNPWKVRLHMDNYFRGYAHIRLVTILSWQHRAANVDPFTRDLLDIAKKVSQEGVAQVIYISEK